MAAERLFSHLKCAPGLGHDRHRSDSLWAVHTLIVPVTMHIQSRAGVLAADFDRKDTAQAA